MTKRKDEKGQSEARIYSYAGSSGQTRMRRKRALNTEDICDLFVGAGWCGKPEWHETRTTVI